jgi:hypothetical protein
MLLWALGNFSGDENVAFQNKAFDVLRRVLCSEARMGTKSGSQVTQPAARGS